MAGEPFILIVYSFGPILAVPVGRIRFCALNALTTSEGVRPLASNARVSRSTEISRDLPPYGYGTAAPGIVTSCGRRKFSAVSLSACSESFGLDRPSWITGMLEAE